MKADRYPSRAPEFRPPAVLAHPHLQSLLAAAPLRRPLIGRRAAALLGAARPEILDCGDARLLGYYSPRLEASRGLVIMLHGWEGSADASYVLGAGAGLFAAGFDIFRLNFRDHGDTHELNEELFHSCRIDEVVAAVKCVTRLHPCERVLLVGHSLGGNFALRVGVRAPAAGLGLSGIVAVCPVLKPHATMRALEDGLWVYRRYFLNRWRRSLQAKAASFPQLYDFGDLRRFPTLTATTDFFVRRYTPFADLDAYLLGYDITGRVLADLTVPSRIIAAADDPVIPIRDLDDLAAPAALALSVLDRGGHCGFIESYGLRSWLDRAVRAEVEHLADG